MHFVKCPAFETMKTSWKISGVSVVALPHALTTLQHVTLRPPPSGHVSARGLSLHVRVNHPGRSHP